uniref:Uncharacterized protein n=1 Tax=Brassica campestris TaxID=3711 RepID=A0A3P5ZQC9_BRACM|nr:unnamed protein product [Brassica rapa]
MAGTNQSCIFCQIIRNPTSTTLSFTPMRRSSRFKTSSPPLRGFVFTFREEMKTTHWVVAC